MSNRSTPGPWGRQPAQRGRSVYEDRGLVIWQKSTGTVVAHAAWDNPQAQQNATLIAAAPELRATLEAALAIVGDQEGPLVDALRPLLSEALRSSDCVPLHPEREDCSYGRRGSSTRALVRAAIDRERNRLASVPTTEKAR